MLSALWNDFLQYAEKTQQNNPIFLSLLRHIHPLTISETTITLSCDNNGTKMYLEKKKDQIADMLFNHLQKRLTVEFTLETKKTKTEEPLFQFQPSKEDAYIKAGLNTKFTFDNFAVSSSNQVAFAAAQSVAKTPGTSYNPLFFYGGVGVGKTHLAQAVARRILELNPDKKIYFCPGDQFTNELIEAIREKSTAKFRRKYRHLNMMIVDDIQFIAGKNTIQEEFFHTFNSIVSAGGQIILTSDRPPHEIKNLEDRLRSRFSGGLIVDIQIPDFELRAAILLIKAAEKNIAIDMEAAKIIAEQITDSRSLEGTLISIYAKTLGKKERIDLDVVEEFFQDKRKNPESKKITPHDVVKAVCNFYDVKQAHVKSDTRKSDIALARQIIMHILRVELSMKYEEIAYFLKRKDHTTIMHGEEKISRLLMKDSNFKQEIDRIVSSLRSST
jgi:chromosomal replication initiator protein